MDAVAGVFRRQRAGRVVEDGIAVDIEDRFVVGELLELGVACVDGRILKERRVGLFLRRVENGLQKDDGVRLELAHFVEQDLVLCGPALRRAGAELVDAEHQVNFAVVLAGERLCKRLLAGELRLFDRRPDRQTVVAKVVGIWQARVVLEAVGVRVADEQRVVKVARVHRGEGGVGRFRFGLRFRVRKRSGVWDGRWFGRFGLAPRVDPVCGRCGHCRDGRRRGIQFFKIVLIYAGGVERGVGVERQRADKAQRQQEKGTRGHERSP